jgi:hypothetical protein
VTATSPEASKLPRTTTKDTSRPTTARSPSDDGSRNQSRLSVLALVSEGHLNLCAMVSCYVLAAASLGLSTPGLDEKRYLNLSPIAGYSASPLAKDGRPSLSIPRSKRLLLLASLGQAAPAPNPN